MAAQRVEIASRIVPTVTWNGGIYSVCGVLRKPESCKVDERSKSGMFLHGREWKMKDGGGSSHCLT